VFQFTHLFVRRIVPILGPAADVLAGDPLPVGGLVVSSIEETIVVLMTGGDWVVSNHVGEYVRGKATEVTSEVVVQ